MNKKMFVVGMLVAFISAGVWAVGFSGTPTAELKQGEWSIGFNYMYSTQDLETTKTKYGWTGDTQDTDRLKLKDFNVNRYYGVLGYGITDQWEVYVQLGVSDMKLENSFSYQDSYWGLNFDNDFAWGFGTRITLAQQDNVKWGLSAQMNWFDASVDYKGEGYKDTYTVDGYDVLIAFGPTVDMGGWKLYGGAFYYCMDGDWEDKYTETGEAGYWKETGKLRADGNFGGFIGAQFDVAQSTNMTVEFSSTGSSGWALGTGIAFKF